MSERKEERKSETSIEDSGLPVSKLREAQELIKYLTTRDEGLIAMIVYDQNWNQLLNKQRWGELAADISVRLFIATTIATTIAKRTKVKRTKARLEDCIQKLKGYINQTPEAERRATSSVPPTLYEEVKV